jgi:hypothetical protein
MMRELTIYFTIHCFPEVLKNKEFLRAFGDCRVFLVEASDQWASPDLQEQYNDLSQGKRDRIGDKIERQLSRPFQEELERVIYRSFRKIVLEQSPFSSDIELRGNLEQDLREGLDEVVADRRLRFQKLATRMIKRDCVLVGLIEKSLATETGLFTFRGATHEEWLCRLLRNRNIEPDVIRFPSRRTAEERIVVPLTNGEEAPDIEILRWIYVQRNPKQNLQEHLEVETQAERLTEEDLRTNLTEYTSSKAGH